MVPVIRKPRPQDFVRVHPGEEFRGIFALIELKEDREFYVLPTAIAAALPGEYYSATIYTAITRQGKLFLWPVKIQDPNARVNEWHRTAGTGALQAMTKWVRLRPDMALGANEIQVAEGALNEPDWPPYSFMELLKIGFRDRLVDSVDHAVIKKLRGLI